MSAFDAAAYAQMTTGQKAAYTKRMRAAGAAPTSTARRSGTTWKAKGTARRLTPELAAIEQMARDKMAEHDLFDKGYKFAWSTATVSAGKCKAKLKNGQVVFGVISLSRPIFSKPENQPEALETILHEIAHALAGPKHHHDWKWRMVAKSIGCTGDRCHTMPVDRAPRPWVADCPCGLDHTMTRPPKHGKMCRGCSVPLVYRFVAPDATMTLSDEREE